MGRLLLRFVAVRDSGKGFSSAVASLSSHAGPGCYVVRQDGEVVYVGRAMGTRAGAIYKTMTRHFQRWERRENRRDWTGVHGETPGLTYSGRASEVAVLFAEDAGDAARLEVQLVRALRPRDNTLLLDLEDAPF